MRRVLTGFLLLAAPRRHGCAHGHLRHRHAPGDRRRAVVGLLEDAWLVGGARQLAAALREKGWAEGTDLRYLEQAEGNHDEISWGSQMPDVLRFLLPRAGRSPRAAVNPAPARKR